MLYCRSHGKQIFLTRWPAERLVAELHSRKHSIKGSVYRCEFCHHYHITHYSFEDRMPVSTAPKIPKKILRSLRRTKHQTSRFAKRNLPLNHHKAEYIMKHIQILQPGISTEEMSYKLSCAVGLVKLIVGCNYGAASVLIGEAIYRLRQSKHYRGEVKRQLNLTTRAMGAYENLLTHPKGDDLLLFDPSTFSSDFTEQFHDKLTTSEHFEFWKAVGGCFYAKYHNLMFALAYKYELWLRSVNDPDPAPLSLCMAASVVLDICNRAYTATCRNAQRQIPAINPTLTSLAHALDPLPILLPWDRMIHCIVDRYPDMTPDQMRNIQLATSAIEDKATDPIVIKQMELEAIQDYREVFRSRRHQCQSIERQRKMMESIREEIINDRRKELKS